jgi:hypothetical protein
MQFGADPELSVGAQSFAKSRSRVPFSCALFGLNDAAHLQVRP